MFRRLLLIFLIVFFSGLAAIDTQSLWEIKRLVWFRRSAGPDESSALLRENIALRARLAELEIISRVFPRELPHGIPVLVYSRYPFNLKSEILVSAGKAHAVMPGNPVVLPSPADGSLPHTLVGKIKEVFEAAALALTVFDGRFQLPVRIGEGAVEALLQGGNRPALVLIPKEAPITEGDPVSSASPDFPYGLAVGSTGKVRLSDDGLFQEAELIVPYDVNALSALLVLKAPQPYAP